MSGFSQDKICWTRFTRSPTMILSPDSQFPDLKNIQLFVGCVESSAKTRLVPSRKESRINWLNSSRRETCPSPNTYLRPSIAANRFLSPYSKKTGNSLDTEQPDWPLGRVHSSSVIGLKTMPESWRYISELVTCSALHPYVGSFQGAFIMSFFPFKISGMWQPLCLSCMSF